MVIDMEQKQIVKTHRVGTLTFGSILIIYGILFLTHIFFPALRYGMIFRLWPCIFILLGIEVLIGNYRWGKQEQAGEKLNFVYDKAAILLLICLIFFAMIMALMDFCIQYGTWRIGF